MGRVRWGAERGGRPTSPRASPPLSAPLVAGCGPPSVCQGAQSFASRVGVFVVRAPVFAYHADGFGPHALLKAALYVPTGVQAAMSGSSVS